MHGNDQEVFEQALRWRQAGQRCVLVTVLRTFGASPRPPGAMAAISERGLIVGSVSGGCVEDDLVHEVMQGGFWHAPTQGHGDVAGVPPMPVALRVYGRDAAERERYRLPCGNALRLAIEPGWQTDVIEQALQAIRSRQAVLRQLDYASGQAQLAPASRQSAFDDDATGFEQVLGPCCRLLLIGATEISRYLLPIARSLGFAVSICDPRREYTEAWQDTDAPLLPGMPDDAVLAFGCDERSAVITLTHDPKLDDMALMQALKSKAFYVGALGSHVTTAKRKARLLQLDLSPEQVAVLRGPVGLPIGSRAPAEIAVSIAAELVQVRRLLETGGKPLATHADGADWASGPPTADPACGLLHG